MARAYSLVADATGSPGQRFSGSLETTLIGEDARTASSEWIVFELAHGTGDVRIDNDNAEFYGRIETCRH